MLYDELMELTTTRGGDVASSLAGFEKMRRQKFQGG